MAFFRKLLLSSMATLLCLPLAAQDLAPRAYVIARMGLNAGTRTWSYF
jgi:hypothetical protein